MLILKNNDFLRPNRLITAKKSLRKSAPKDLALLKNTGLNDETLSYFIDQIYYCKKRCLPVFSHKDLTGEEIDLVYYNSTYKSFHRNSQKEILFYNEPLLSRRLIEHVIIAPSPIELMSFYQIHSSFSDTTQGISILSGTKHQPFKNIISAFPNATFTSIHDKYSSYDNLRYISMELTARGLQHKIEIEQGKANIQVGKKYYSCQVDNVNAEFILKTRRRQPSIINHKPPFRNYQSFNSIINEK